ncbi:cholesterol 25-hydroxylase-like protein [Bombina bombina]|uniref:cholesterol 25-hydroxylase-like protein n=1 Tax=Bombina bombina TaxID=8345 RepID=UPI00235A6E65|nr:cholesterol 25-hydroxylase-like protein [Bombina bombina]
MNSSSCKKHLASFLSSRAELNHLILQPIWDIVRSQEQWIKSPFYPVIFAFTVCMMFCIPYLMLDFLARVIPELKKYQLQPRTNTTLAMVLHCLTLTVYSHLVFVFPVTVAYWWWRPVHLPLAAPELHRFVLDSIACLLLFDFQYFIWHVLHHKVPWLYKTFHKQHHKYTSTFALATQYSSAWEMLSLGFFAGVSPMMLGCHPMTEMGFFILNIYLSVEDHSGYDLPWSTHKIIPFGLCGGPGHHDLHHEKIFSNYAPYFTHWDKLFRTQAKQSSK